MERSLLNTMARQWARHPFFLAVVSQTECPQIRSKKHPPWNMLGSKNDEKSKT